MSKRNQFKITISISILISLYSCNCDKEETYLITEKAKEYFASFDDESYWVYQETSGKFKNDTLILYNLQNSLNFSYTESKCDGDYYEIINYNLVPKNSKDSLKVGLGSNRNYDNYSLQGYFNGQYLYNSHLIQKNTGEFRPYTKDNFNLFENYSINGKQYKDVIKIEHTQLKNANTGFIPEFLHSSKVGLVEFTIYDTSTNQVLRYQLIDYSIK